MLRFVKYREVFFWDCDWGGGIISYIRIVGGIEFFDFRILNNEEEVLWCFYFLDIFFLVV